MKWVRAGEGGWAHPCAGPGPGRGGGRSRQRPTFGDKAGMGESAGSAGPGRAGPLPLRARRPFTEPGPRRRSAAPEPSPGPRRAVTPPVPPFCERGPRSGSGRRDGARCGPGSAPSRPRARPQPGRAAPSPSPPTAPRGSGPRRARGGRRRLRCLRSRPCPPRSPCRVPAGREPFRPPRSAGNAPGARRAPRNGPGRPGGTPAAPRALTVGSPACSRVCGPGSSSWW